MKLLIYITILLIFITILLTRIYSFEIKDHDRILITGGFKTHYGLLSPFGFVNLIKKEIMEGKSLKSIFNNVTIVSESLKNGNVISMKENFESKLLKYKPTIAIIMVGDDDIKEIEESEGYIAWDSIQFRNHLEIMVDYCISHNITFILTTPTFHGESEESIDIQHEYDLLYEEATAIVKRVDKLYQNHYLYGGLIDLRSKLLKYLERIANIHNRPRYMLTYDGVHLNKEGNIFIASIILKHFGYLQKEKDNIEKNKLIFEYVDDSILYKVLNKHGGNNNLGGRKRFYIKDIDREANNNKKLNKNDEL